MMPYDTYRLYRIQRVNSLAEAQRADERASAARVRSLIAGSWHHVARASYAEAIPGGSAGLTRAA